MIVITDVPPPIVDPFDVAINALEDGLDTIADVLVDLDADNQDLRALHQARTLAGSLVRQIDDLCRTLEMSQMARAEEQGA